MTATCISCISCSYIWSSQPCMSSGSLRLFLSRRLVLCPLAPGAFSIFSDADSHRQANELPVVSGAWCSSVGPLMLTDRWSGRCAEKHLKRMLRDTDAITDTFLILSFLHCPMPFFIAYSPLSLLSLRRTASSNNSVNKAQVDNHKLRSFRCHRRDYRSHILSI